MPKKPKKKSAAKRSKLQTTKAAPELPEWLVETPLETEYLLRMSEGGIELDPEEIAAVLEAAHA